MKFKPGEHFHYNNAGFIVFVLIIKQHTNMPVTEYIKKIFSNGLEWLIQDFFQWINFRKIQHMAIWRKWMVLENKYFFTPLRGGGDGGAYITAPDIGGFWKALFNYQLLRKETNELLLSPHSQVKATEFYGYGLWLTINDGPIFKYHVMGFDPGVNFMSSVYSTKNIELVVASNKEKGAYNITNIIEESLIRYHRKDQYLNLEVMFMKGCFRKDGC
ncbi:serine hydrolase [Mesobacillus maritimus]|nr:serine hydrolase [Mesobacillus maritimus]